mgnify:CR=1 FL=1
MSPIHAFFTAPSFGGAVFDVENAIEKLLEGEIMNQKISIRSCLIAFFSAGFLAFGMYNVHTVAEITEGGVLGAVLLIQHWFHISPAFSSACCIVTLSNVIPMMSVFIPALPHIAIDIGILP